MLRISQLLTTVLLYQPTTIIIPLLQMHSTALLLLLIIRHLPPPIHHPQFLRCFVLNPENILILFKVGSGSALVYFLLAKLMPIKQFLSFLFVVFLSFCLPLRIADDVLFPHSVGLLVSIAYVLLNVLHLAVMLLYPVLLLLLFLVLQVYPAQLIQHDAIAHLSNLRDGLYVVYVEWWGVSGWVE